MAPRPRKKLDTKSKNFATQFAIHLQALLDRRKLSRADFRSQLKSAALDVSVVTVGMWLTGDRLPRCHDLPAIGAALGMKDYRDVLPPL